MTISKILGCPSLTNQRRPHDAYATPSACTEALVRVESKYWPKILWEPCAGDGAITRILRRAQFKVVETDLVITGDDFLKTTSVPGGSWPRASAIVTNPPFRHATEFILHAHALGIGYHAWLLRADFLNAKRGLRLVDEIGYPVRVHALVERPDFLGQGAPTMNCAWYCWDGRRHASANLRLLSIHQG